MDGKSAPKPNRLLNEARSLFNNPELSDVRFLVDGQTVYGHKLILAMGSPVFKSMFFGELKEKREVIEIEDLTLVGFKNVLRYIYGFEIDFELSELYESYMAADKYLLNDFGETFFEYIKSKLNAASSCLIYDQLIKIGEREEIPLADVRALIIESSKETIANDHFTQIDRETLISLLSLDKLSIAEIDLLAAVSKWVDCEVQRQDLPVNDENRRKVFEPIKGYVLFTALKLEEIADREEIAQLLSAEERGLLLLHLLSKKNPLMTELKTSRNAGSSYCSAFVMNTTRLNSFRYLTAMYLSVNRRVRIRTIHLTYRERASSLNLTVLNSAGVDLALKPERSMKNGKICFSFDPPFDVEPNSRYTLKNDCIDQTDGDELSNQEELRFEDSIIFKLERAGGYIYHFVSGLEFLPLD